MKNIANSWITQNITLWTTFVATMVLMLMIFIVANQNQLTLLDTIANPENARQIIADMTSQQRNVHLWITATLDVFYPLAYGCLFAGIAWRFFPEFGTILALPALLAIVTDLAEGAIQILALAAIADLLPLKIYLTPLKFILVAVALIIAITGLLKSRFSYFDS